MQQTRALLMERVKFWQQDQAKLPFAAVAR